MATPTLTDDLKATRLWIERNTDCSHQRGDEGWWAQDCIARATTPKCDRCLVLQRLDRQLRQLARAEAA